MKRIVVATIISCSFLAFASEEGKVSIGIKFSPSLAFSRVSPNSFNDANGGVNYQYDALGAKLRFGVGVMVDYMIRENYGFSTGLNFLLNGSGYSVVRNNIGPENNTYSVQYVQVPLLFKLQTGEIMDDLRIYFKTGATVDVLVGARLNGQKSVQIGTSTVNTSEWINKFHSSLVFSPGIEYAWKAGIKFVFGFTYSRGLTNVDNSNQNTESKITGFDMNNDFISLDFGVKF